MNSPASGWQRDPTARHEYRYWDGSRWTDDVSDRGVTTTDPMPPGPGADPTQVIDPTQAFPSAPAAPTEAYGQPPASGNRSDGAPGFGPYGTLPNQPGAYGSYGSGGGPPAAGPPPNTGARTGLFVGIGVLVVAVVAGVAFLLTKDDDDPDETSTLPLSEETTPGDDGTSTLPSDTGDDTSDGSGDPGEIDSLDDLANVDPDEIDEEDLIPLVAEELSSSGVMTEEQATCMAEAMFETFSLDEIIALGESGATDPMSALTPEQLNAITSAAVDCMGGAVEP
jgi:hypothetical protein